VCEQLHNSFVDSFLPLLHELLLAKRYTWRWKNTLGWQGCAVMCFRRTARWTGSTQHHSLGLHQITRVCL